MKRALVMAVLVAAPALAWESVCYQYANSQGDPAALASAERRPCAPASGPTTARNRWVGPLDEHRQLWEATAARAGLPAELSSTQVLTVYTSAALAAGTDAGTLIPAPFEEAVRVQQRAFTPGELAQLPDFGYALWDWASGHETCPLDSAGADPVLCHDFASHMGPVNSNHFLPQAREFYVRYHQLALDRAAECQTLNARLAGAHGRFWEVPQACELEALTLEALGQHFLQDAWSMGHMWQRWGSANLSEFPGATPDEQRDRAVLVALVAGLFHGARGVLQVLPEWAGLDVDDAMCAPYDDVRFVSGAEVHTGLGDDYLAQLPPNSSDPSYDFQSTRFFDCAASGMLEVYRAAGEIHGAAAPGAGLSSVDPRSAECFGQRATNASLVRGAAINFKVVGAQVTVPLDARFVSWMLPKVARQQGKVPVDPKLRNEFRLGLQRVVSVARLVAKDNPDGTELADGRMGALLGAKPNGQYTAAATYLDPPLPWGEGAAANTEAEARAAVLSRTFHRAHASELCEAFDVARLAALRAHAQDTGLDGASKTAACQACTEIAVRHLRVGVPAAYDSAQEPLCTYLMAAPDLVYHQVAGVTDPAAVAASWCCP